MDEIGLFPLGLVLLPTEQVPLHIFEPRYRELIGETLEHGRPFGIVYADEDGLRQVGTLATVTEVVERFADGRLNIIVEGGARFRLLELTEGRAFATGSVEPFDDQHDPAEPADIERALALFARLVELTAVRCRAPGAGDARALVRDRRPVRVLAGDQAGALDESSERVRLQRLCELLAIAAETVERQKEIASRAQTNGKVEPPALTVAFGGL